MCLAFKSPSTKTLSFGCQRVWREQAYFPHPETNERVRLVAASFAEWQLPPCRHADEHKGEQQLGGPHLFLMQLDDFPTPKWCPETFCPELPKGSLPSAVGFF